MPPLSQEIFMRSMALLMITTIVLLPFGGCVSHDYDCCEDLDRNIIVSDTAIIEPDKIAFVTILDWENSQEAFARELMKSPYYGDDPDCNIYPAGEGGCEGENLTYERALEVIGGNSTHDASGHLYEKQWSDYEGYEWEVNLLSENGKYDVLWLDAVESIRFNSHGDLDRTNAKPALTKKGMTGNNSLGPKLSPNHSCADSDDPFVMDCPVPMGFQFFSVYIVNKGSTAIEVEYSIFGWG